MFKVVMALATFVVAMLTREAAKLRKKADSHEDNAELLYQASLRAEEKATQARREASRVHRMAQKLGGVLK